MFMAANARPVPFCPAEASVPDLRNGSIDAVYYGQRCAGDFYDFLRVTPERVLFGLFDIAGKVEQTRHIVIALQEQFRSSGMSLLHDPDANESEAMHTLWLEINHAVMKAAAGVHPCPAFMGCYNEQLGTLCYVNAGHTPGLVGDHADITQLNATALPLGLFSHSVPDSSMIAVSPGNTLLAVSKGMVEARHRGEEYGIDRVSNYLRGTVMDTAHELCVGILSEIKQFMGTAPTHNDVTALSLIRAR
jgi:sigma-B regulation protein RsbU (phosphoserine phosphatase)